MTQIPLSKGKFAVVDSEDSHLANFKWHYLASGSGYAARHFKKEDGSDGYMYMHHCVIGYPLKNKNVDHIDNNSLNNQKHNLRVVTVRENMSNQRRKREGKTTSKFVGVSWNANSKKWLAYIRMEGTNKYLGSYEKEEQASEKYQKVFKQMQVIGR